MNIQIFGKSKCFDTKKAERYFKERKIKFQSIDVAKYGMSKGEFNSVKTAVGGLDKLIDEIQQTAMQCSLNILRAMKLKSKSFLKIQSFSKHQLFATASRRP